jgi:phosphoribosylformylglycinamidine synthase subunit PurSL
MSLQTLQSELVYPPNTLIRIDILPRHKVFSRRHQTIAGNFYTQAVYWIESPSAISHATLEEALLDPVLETMRVHVDQYLGLDEVPWSVEVSFLPGVTDNLAQTVVESIALISGQRVSVASGMVYQPFEPCDLIPTKEQLAHQLYNPLVQRCTLYMQNDASLERMQKSMAHVKTDIAVAEIALNLEDSELLDLSQNMHLALSLEEMQSIQSHFQDSARQHARKAVGLPVWPTDVELEIIAQTWSEHCKHKIFNAEIDYQDTSIPDFPVQYKVSSLFKTYIAGATDKLAAQRPDLLSVFKDNAGIVQFDSDWGICFKVETHNSPSALEPYGGALTGIVGVNRDILGTGLGAKPIFNTDVFCFAHPEEAYASRPSMLPPEAVLLGVRKGVEDGGNKSGIPTVNGSLFFDPRYRSKPLVFCGTGGLLPLRLQNTLDATQKHTQVGHAIVMVGGRVGKDGIHGATFSSESFNEKSLVSAVQIGDPITQKRMSDFILAARDAGLITGITDNGAGGLSSSVGEMAELTHGATLHLDWVPLKYVGLQPFEIAISESQERMTLSTNQVDELLALSAHYGVESTVIGEFTESGFFSVFYQNKPVGHLDLDFLHHGCPPLRLKAHWHNKRTKPIFAGIPDDMTQLLQRILGLPNICSREALIRQYDHEVQGTSVLKPLAGPYQTSPMDAAVLKPLVESNQGLVISNGICPQYGDWDAYHMATCAVDEAVRNAVAVGCDPSTITLLDNFCWPDPVPSDRNPDAELKMAQLVRACSGLHDIAVAYKMPFISGKDSMKNDFDDGVFRLSVPATVLVSAMGTMPDVNQALSMHVKQPGDLLYLLGKTSMHLGASAYYRVTNWYCPYAPNVDTLLARKLYPVVYQAIQQGLLRSCHDLSEGGLAVSLSEVILGTDYGCDVSLEALLEHAPELRWDEALFSESPSRFILSVSPAHQDALEQLFSDLPLQYLGRVTEQPELTIRLEEDEAPVMASTTEALRRAWQKSPAQVYAEDGLK